MTEDNKSKPDASRKKSLTERFLEARGKRWVLLYLVQLHVLAVFMSIVPYLLQAYSTIQSVLVESGITVDVVLIVVIAWAAWMAYAAILCLHAIIDIHKGKEIKPLKFNVIFSWITIFLFFAMYLAITVYTTNRHNFQLGPPYRLFQFVGLLLLLEVTIALVLLSITAVSKLKINMQRSKRVAGVHGEHRAGELVLVLCIYTGILVLPYILVPPNVIPGNLPRKPQFIAHRGGGFLGPENTIEGAIAMHQYNVVGWEIDVQVSKDGVPFLMHDSTLARTTNVAEVFPGREFEPAEDFTIAELRLLDAGSKFLSDPNAITARQYLNETTLDSYRGAKIATLAEAINKSIEWNWMIEPDFKCSSVCENLVLGMILNSSVSQVWLGGRLEITDPRVKHETGDIEGNPAALQALGYDIVGGDLTFDDTIVRKMTSSNLPVYVQIIDDPVSFSDAWTLGCRYVLTDSAFLFQSMNAPLWYLPSWAWFCAWLALDALICVLFIYTAFPKKD
jgi:hypothetical protein